MKIKVENDPKYYKYRHKSSQSVSGSFIEEKKYLKHLIFN